MLIANPDTKDIINERLEIQGSEMAIFWQDGVHFVVSKEVKELST